PLQQLRPLDAHRDARGREHPRRRPPRHLGGQRRERLPRGGRRGPAPLRRRPRDAGDGAAAGVVARVGVLDRLLGVVLVAGVLAAPSAALAQGTTANPFNGGQTNPLTPGLPQPSVSVPAAPTPTVITTASTSGSGSGLSGGSAIAIAIGAIVLLGGISFFIWRDARRRAPVR